jgi:hypothetical protein
MKIDPIVKDILNELKFNPAECLWEKHGATCMKHRYIEIAAKNNKNSYPYAMAEKRAVDRAILKLIGIHGFVYSDDEVNEPMLIETTHPVPKLHIATNNQKIDDIYIATALDVIEKNPHKKNSTALRSDLENLKTRMFKVKLKNGTKWDEFKKTEQFSKYVSLENQHKPKRS